MWFFVLKNNALVNILAVFPWTHGKTYLVGWNFWIVWCIHCQFKLIESYFLKLLTQFTTPTIPFPYSLLHYFFIVILLKFLMIFNPKVCTYWTFILGISLCIICEYIELLKSFFSVFLQVAIIIQLTPLLYSILAFLWILFVIKIVVFWTFSFKKTKPCVQSKSYRRPHFFKKGELFGLF